MPKTSIDFNVPINVLIRDDGTKEALIALAYLRGEGSSFASPVREALAQYVENAIAKMTPAERKRYDEILENVRLTERTRRAIRSGTPRVKVTRRSLKG